MAPESEYTARVLTDAELAAIPWNQIEPNWLRNPFASVINDPIGGANGHRWCIVHGELEDPDAPPAEFDPFEDLLSDTKRGPPPMVEVGGGKPGYGVAIFPRRPTGPNVEAEWEERSIAMHQAQNRIDPDSLPRKIEDKPRQIAAYEADIGI